jgi:hypothetical protein
MGEHPAEQACPVRAGSMPLTFNTKFGRVTGPEWIRQRFLEEAEKWLTDEALHYCFTRTPYYDANGREIHDTGFLRLLRESPGEAARQLSQECDTYLNHLAVGDKQRAEQEEAAHQQIALF